MKKIFYHASIFNRGFTLVEIMIVVFIIGLLVAMAVPSFLRMRLDANEALVRADLRVFSTANESYRATQNPPAYADDIETLIDQNYLDDAWLDPGNRHGYDFVYAVSGDGSGYSLEADVLTENVTGINYYCVDQTGVIVKGDDAGMGTDSGCEDGTPIQG